MSEQEIVIAEVEYSGTGGPMTGELEVPVPESDAILMDGRHRAARRKIRKMFNAVGSDLEITIHATKSSSEMDTIRELSDALFGVEDEEKFVRKLSDEELVSIARDAAERGQNEECVFLSAVFVKKEIDRRDSLEIKEIIEIKDE